MKWIRDIERFIELAAVLWLFEVVFKLKRE